MKLIEVITDQQNLKSITGIAKQHSSEINWVGPPDEQDRQLIRLLVSDKDRQLVLDALQGFFRTIFQDSWLFRWKSYYQGKNLIFLK